MDLNKITRPTKVLGCGNPNEGLYDSFGSEQHEER